MLSAIAFFAQVSDNAGPGAWATAIAATINLFVFALALKKGERNIVKSDWYSLFGALGAIVLWLITKDPTTSVILLVLIDIMAFIPTFRKSYHKPYEETLVSYVINIIKHVTALMALNKYSIVTGLYQTYAAAACVLFVGMLFVRRRQLDYNTGDGKK